MLFPRNLNSYRIFDYLYEWYTLFFSFPVLRLKSWKHLDRNATILLRIKIVLGCFTRPLVIPWTLLGTTKGIDVFRTKPMYIPLASFLFFSAPPSQNRPSHFPPRRVFICLHGTFFFFFFPPPSPRLLFLIFFLFLLHSSPIASHLRIVCASFFFHRSVSFFFFFFFWVYSPFESLFCLNIDKNEKWFIIHIYITPINRYLSNISNFAFCQQQEKKFEIKVLSSFINVFLSRTDFF